MQRLALIAKTEQVGGIATDVIRIACRRRSNLHFVVFPGNPGIVQFYQPFLASLAHQVGDYCHIHALSYAGHSINSPSNGQLYSLDQQIQHKMAFLDSIAASYEQKDDPPRFILFGHSIGSYVCLQIMKLRPDLRVLHAFLGFPFLRFDLHPLENFKFRTMFAFQILVAGFAALLGCLPLSWRMFLVRLFTGSKNHDFLTTVANMLKYSIIRNGLFLGRDEFNVMPRSFDAPHPLSLSRVSSLATALFTRADRWSPIIQYHELKPRQNLRCILSSEVNSVPLEHAFCVDEKQSQVVADICCDLLVKMNMVPKREQEVRPSDTPNNHRVSITSTL
eukprot:TRINITY_DN15118_c0_g3_i3.p1 TRINITY_DN15118_c0_g3~~TRINITY_DN15118_c0_g3_i3.p1  ORF type:complete len:334 (+),score=36.18 TRINITY_DN15118_c0_g3_i3:61-1062(+)